MSDILIGQIASAVQLQGFISGKEQLKGSFDLFTLPEHQYEGSYLITPTESEQVLPTSGRTPLGNIKVDPIPEQYIVPSGTITITENGTEDVTQYASASVDVQPSLQAKSVTISKAGNTDITADAGYYGLSKATATVPNYTKTFMTADTRFFTDDDDDRCFGVNARHRVLSAGWAKEEIREHEYTFLAVPSGTTVTPSTSQQTVGRSEWVLEDEITIDPIPSEYIVPSGSVTITQQNNTDVTEYASANVVSGVASQGTQFGYTSSGTRWRMRGYNNVTSAGWFESGQTEGAWASFYAVPSGTVVTPSESSQTVGGSDYMMQGAVTVSPIPSQYIVPSGTISISSNSTVDVTQYASASVNVPTPSPSLQLLAKEYTPSDTEQIFFITPSAGYDGLSEVDVTVKAISPYYVGSSVPRMSSANLTASGATVTAPSGYYQNNATKTISSGSATPASSITGTSATVSSPSSNKIQLTQTISNTPTVSAGYISSGTAGNTSVTLTGACVTKGTTSYYASTSDQTISAGTYITGTQTFKAVSQTNLSAGNIKNGTTISISNGNGNIWSVTGTYSGGGGGDSKNVQIVQNNSTRITSTSYTKACGTITVSKSGTYDIYWCAYRTSSSGTWGTQWYKNGTAQGSVQSFSSYYQAIHLTNISLAQNDTIDVYGRSRGSNYYLYVGQLTIIEV